MLNGANFYTGTPCHIKSCLLRLFIFCVVLALCRLCSADTVVLTEGQKLTGKILADRQNLLYLDVGIDVLRIPKDSILEYEYTKDLAGKDIQSDTPALPQTGSLYATGGAGKMSIEKCVEAVSEAVVKVASPTGIGSGFFINDRGYLITNYHVIEKETKITVTVFEKAEDGFEKTNFKKVKIEAINPFVDLALLKVEDLGDKKVQYAALGDIDKLRVGESVFAVGNPLGLERTVTNGVVSTINRAFEGLVYVQTNADINPGNSGGPLFNLAGEVIGVTNMGYIFFGGLGFAIPVDYVRHFLDNRDAFAYDKDNPNTGFRYLQPALRTNRKTPELFD